MEAGELRFEEQVEEEATYAEKIDPSERRLDPSRPAAELERTVRALTPHVGAYLETADGKRLGVGRARAVDAAVRKGDVRAEWGASAARLRSGGPAPRGRAAGGRQADGGRRLPARPRVAEAVSGERASVELWLFAPRAKREPIAVITQARAVALEVVRATFEDGAFTERAFRERGRRPRPRGRERAQSQRLTYGAVQRRATADAAIARLSSRPLNRLDPPVLAVASARPLRAAVHRRDPRPRRRRPGGRVGRSRPERRTPPASSTRCCGARRGSERRSPQPSSATTDSRTAPRSPTRCRPGWLGCGGRSWGRTARARCSPPATSRPRSPCGASLHKSRASLAAQGIRCRCLLAWRSPRRHCL